LEVVEDGKRCSLGRKNKRVTGVDEDVDPSCSQLALCLKMSSHGPKPLGRSEPLEKARILLNVNSKIQGSLKP
jgi:hypothetical protein